MKLRVELEDITPVKKKLKVEIPAEVALGQFNQVTQAYRRRARLPGFRPGKAPLGLVKRRFHHNIRHDVLQKLVPESYDDALRQQGVQPLGQPSFENLQCEEGEPLVYEAYLEVPPHISLPSYQGLEVSLKEEAVQSRDVEEELEKIREKYAPLVSVGDRPAQQNDYAVFDLRAEFLDGEKRHQSWQEENLSAVVGDDHTHRAFNEALGAMEVEGRKVFEVDYPPDYPDPELASHRVRYALHLKEIKQKQLPDLDDDLAKDVGEFESVDQLRDHVRQSLAEQHTQRREHELRNLLLDRLIEQSDFDVPQILVERRLEDKLRDLQYNIAAQGVHPSKANVDWLKVRTELEPSAIRDVKASLLLREIAQREDIQASAEEADEELARIAESTDQPREKLRQQFQREGGMKQLRAQIQRRKALDFLREQAKVGEI